MTAIRMPGKRLLLLRSRIAAKVVAPTTNAIQLTLPSSTAPPIAHRLRNGPSASIEKPNSLGSWLINTVKAMPFM
jgi:hypothetical protein